MATTVEFELTTKEDDKWITLSKHHRLDVLKNEGKNVVDSGDAEFVNIITRKPFEVVWTYKGE